MYIIMYKCMYNIIHAHVAKYNNNYTYIYYNYIFKVCSYSYNLFIFVCSYVSTYLIIIFIFLKYVVTAISCLFLYVATYVY